MGRRARRRGALSRRGAGRRSRLRARHHRGHQPGGKQLSPAADCRRVAGARDDHGAPRQHRPVAACRRRYHADTDRRRRRPRPRRRRGAPGPPPGAARRGARLEHARHRQSDRGALRPGACTGRSGAGRRRAGRAPPPDRSHPPRLRLLLFFGPQGIRSHRDRRAVGPARPPRGDAAVPGRRRHDRRGDVRADHLRAAAAALRGRHASHRRRDRARCGTGVAGGTGSRRAPGARRRSRLRTARDCCRPFPA